MFRLADVAFVDRGNTAQAKAALEPAVERLREGVSLVIAAGGHPLAHPGAGPVQEGRVPRRHAGGCADRPDRDPQRRRADVARRVDDPRGHRADRGAAAGADRRVDRRGDRQAGRGGAGELRGDPRRLGRGVHRHRLGRPGHREPDRARRGAAGLGHVRRDEPARDGDVAGRGGRPAAAFQRHAAGAARHRPGLGAAASARTSGRRGWCRGCASGWSTRRSGSARRPGSPSSELDLVRHVLRVTLPAPGTAAPAARRRAGVRGALRSTATGRCGASCSSRGWSPAVPATSSPPTTAPPTGWARCS